MNVSGPTSPIVPNAPMVARDDGARGAAAPQDTYTQSSDDSGGFFSTVKKMALGCVKPALVAMAPVSAGMAGTAGVVGATVGGWKFLGGWGGVVCFMAAVAGLGAVAAGAPAAASALGVAAACGVGWKCMQYFVDAAEDGKLQYSLA